MAKITNHTRDNLDFLVKGPAKNGVPPTEGIAAGETRDVDVIDNATYQGRILSGVISVSGASRAAAAKE